MGLDRKGADGNLLVIRILPLFLAAVLIAGPAVAQDLTSGAIAVRDKALAADPAPPRFGGADIVGLIGLGVPFVDFTNDASRYFDLHHSADDTLDKINPADLAQNVAVWASFLYTVANSDVSFRPPPAP